VWQLYLITGDIRTVAWYLLLFDILKFICLNVKSKKSKENTKPSTKLQLPEVTGVSCHRSHT